MKTYSHPCSCSKLAFAGFLAAVFWALLIHTGNAQSYSLSPIWQVSPANNTNGLPTADISNSGNTDRGLAYNAASNHVIMGTRTGGNGAFAFDAATGTYTNANLSLNMTGVSG